MVPSSKAGPCSLSPLDNRATSPSYGGRSESEIEDVGGDIYTDGMEYFYGFTVYRKFIDLPAGLTPRPVGSTPRALKHTVTLRPFVTFSVWVMR